MREQKCWMHFLVMGFFSEEFWPRKLISQTYGTVGHHFPSVTLNRPIVNPLQMQQIKGIISVLLTLNFWNCPWIILMCHDFVIDKVWTILIAFGAHDFQRLKLTSTSKPSNGDLTMGKHYQSTQIVITLNCNGSLINDFLFWLL